ncbi:MAG TPA: hypothetical protein VKA40_06125 [Nitrososphaera sp.]|nr:hypothetical protein [Nitrososphaera sp.]
MTTNNNTTTQPPMRQQYLKIQYQWTMQQKHNGLYYDTHRCYRTLQYA